jgi:hypothetical protein
MFLGITLAGHAVSQDKSAPAKAVPPVEIKGHHIGETVQEFTIANGTPEQLQQCGDFLGDSSTQKHYAKIKSSTSESDLKFKWRVDECIKLADALSGEPTDFSPKFADHTQARMKFVGNKLVAIYLSFPETQPAVVPAGNFGPLLSFDEVLRDLTAKFGPPDTLGQRQMQNGFGAVFTFPVASWTTRPDVRVYATEDQSEAVTHLTSVEIQDRAYGDTILQEQKDRPNALQ